MRIHFLPTAEAAGTSEVESLRSEFDTIAKEHEMQWSLVQASEKPRTLIMVSKIGRTSLSTCFTDAELTARRADCLNDLLFRTQTQQLPIDIRVIVSNHPDFAKLAETYGIPFVHLPVTPATKAEQEDKLLALAKDHQIDLVVLARYMQILSPKLCDLMSGRIIVRFFTPHPAVCPVELTTPFGAAQNIHHSFLPSFKGAKPYHQACTCILPRQLCGANVRHHSRPWRQAHRRHRSLCHCRPR